MVAVNTQKDATSTFATIHIEILHASPSSKLIIIFKLQIEPEAVVCSACYSLTYAA